MIALCGEKIGNGLRGGLAGKLRVCAHDLFVHHMLCKAFTL
jgi:hypothetical protein